jgi:hypothetical protein
MIDPAQGHEELHGRVTSLEQTRDMDYSNISGPRVTLHRVDAEVTWEGVPNDVVNLFREAP